jgi:hypothetical protein
MAESTNTALSEPIVFQVGVQGTEQAAAALEDLKQKIASLPVANDNAAKSFKDLGTASDEGGAAMLRMRSSGILAIKDIAYNIPQLQPFIGVVSGISRAVTGLTSVLGFSGGLAVGGVLMAISLLAKYFGEASKEADKAAKAIEKSADELETFDKWYEELLKKERATTLEQKLTAGVATEEETRKEKERLVKKMNALQLEREKAVENIKEWDKEKDLFRKKDQIQAAQDLIERNKAEEASLKERANLYAKQYALFGSEAAAAEEDARRKVLAKKTGGKPEEGETTDWMQEVIDKKSPEYLEKMQDMYGEDKKNFEAYMNDKAAWADMALDDFHQKELEAAKKSEKIRKEQLEQDKKANEMRKQAWRELAEAQATMGKLALSTGIESFQELAKGHKLTLASLLESTGDAIVADGTKNLWTAAGILANPFTAAAGGPLMAVALSEIAAGMAMGAAGARGAGAGHGGGGSANPTRQSDQYNYQPQPATQSNVIHVHTLTPTVDAGIAINKSIKAASARRGPGANP